MNPLWIGALIGAGGTLLGTIISGLLNYLNTQQQLQHQRAKESRELRRTKLEELVVKLEQTSVYFSGAITYLLSIKPPEKVDQDKFVGKTPFHVEVMMLTKIYASDLSGSYDKMIRHSHEFADLANQCRNHIDSGKQLHINHPLAVALCEKEDELTKAIINLSVQVVELTKGHLDIQKAKPKRWFKR